MNRSTCSALLGLFAAVALCAQDPDTPQQAPAGGGLADEVAAAMPRRFPIRSPTIA